MSDSAFFIILMGGFFLLYFLIIFSIVVFVIAGQWKMFKKAKQPGWASLIPIYNNYIMCKIAGVNPWWIMILIAGPLFCMCMIFVNVFIAIIGYFLLSFLNIYFQIILSVGLARAYNKEDVFAIGLILLAPIFYMILGFDKDKYVGPRPMFDILFDNFKK